IGLLVPAVQKVREAANRTQCTNNMHQIGMAMLHYQMSAGYFPPAFINKGTNTNWGWLVWIMPDVEQDNPYQQLNPTARPPTLTPATSTTKIPLYMCPSDNSQVVNPFFGGFGKSNYAVSEQISDGNTMGMTPTSTTLKDITDGASNTIMAGERDMSDQVGALWPGRDKATGVQSVLGRPTWPINTKYVAAKPCCAGATTCTRFAWSSLHPGGANFVFCDGSVHFLPATVPTDPSQASCNKPVPANVTFFNLYFKNDGNVVNA